MNSASISANEQILYDQIYDLPSYFNLVQHQDICGTGFRCSVRSALANGNRSDNCSVHLNKVNEGLSRTWGLLLD